MAIPDQPFGFVAGRWVLSKADTPMDSDRAPDYEPLHPGAVIFTNKLSHRVVQDGTGTVGIVKTRIEGQLNSNGDLIDAEGHNFIALPVGVYSVAFSFGQYSWPNFDIEVKAEHTIDSPLWLPSKSPIPAGPGIVHVVSEEARLAAEAAAASAWAAVDTPGRRGPQGVPGPPGDLDTEHLAGAPRLTNLVHNMTWGTYNATIESQTPRLAKFTAEAYNGHIRWGNLMVAGKMYYVSAEVKTTSNKVLFGASTFPVYHSGSGGWEILTNLITPTGGLYYQVRDTRSSGWDPIEVRDPVLIDLTAVFGAGREPSKEYMDELLAKHGNYIGAVEPFAVGDALYSQTLAGQGMGVRVDSSVGTRVLLDHPGGTTMLYGDTGWRSLPVPTDVPGATPAGPTPFRIRRVGDVVHAVIDRITFTSEYVGTTFEIPIDTAFLPKSAYVPHAGYPNGNSRSWIWLTSRLVAHPGTPVVDGRWQWVFTTSQPWPTELPGEPA